MTQRDIGFTQGLGYAIAYLVKHHGEDSLARFLLQESGIQFKEFKQVCDGADLEYIDKARNS